MKNKVTLAISTLVLCGSFATAEAAKHHSVSKHTKHTKHGTVAHKNTRHASFSHHHSKHSHRSLAAHSHRYHEFASESNPHSGVASLYSTRFQGRPTASGEPYDMYEMTAAHRTLPLGSYVEVTNLNNDRTVVVRINDRGPFHGGRMLDLSTAAAEELDMGSTGRVKITPVSESVAMNEFSDEE
jgi:rare lipoprotein A